MTVEYMQTNRILIQNVFNTSGQADIVLDGRSEWKILLNPEAGDTEVLAARELFRYIYRISNVELDTVTVNDTPYRNVIQIDCDQGELDGFELTVEENRITIHGHTPRGALYGVYQLLEDIGCRWFYIGKLGEVVPTLRNIKLPCCQTSQEASFRERSVMVAYPSYYERFDEWIDYLAKQRINNICIYGQSLVWWKSMRSLYLPMLQERQIILEFGGHLLPGFVPRELFDQHPEYFRMNENGQRIKDYNFCLNSGAIEILKKNVYDYFNQLPEITYFHIWADDLTGGGWCHCEKCIGLTSSDQNMIAMNTVADVLTKVNPKASLALLAYHDTGKMAAVKPRSNLFLLNAPRERCYRHAFSDPDCRRNREEYMPLWTELYTAFRNTASTTIHEFDYYTDGLLDREMQPPQVEMIPADARYFHSIGLPVYQNLMVCFREWHSPPFSLVNFMKAAWDAEINGWNVLEDFCRNYYGEELAESMTEYYHKVEESCQLLFNGDPIIGSYVDMTWPPMELDMIKPKIEEANHANRIHQSLLGLLDEALMKVPEGIIRERLSRERDVCELHQYIIELACSHFEGQSLALQYLDTTADNENGQKDLFFKVDYHTTKNSTENLEDGQHAFDMLSDCFVLVEKIINWIYRFPEEQRNLIDGWKSYHSNYYNVFSELKSRVHVKLEKQKGLN